MSHYQNICRAYQTYCLDSYELRNNIWRISDLLLSAIKTKGELPEETLFFYPVSAPNEDIDVHKTDGAHGTAEFNDVDLRWELGFILKIDSTSRFPDQQLRFTVSIKQIEEGIDLSLLSGKASIICEPKETPETAKRIDDFADAILSEITSYFSDAKTRWLQAGKEKVIRGFSKVG